MKKKPEGRIEVKLKGKHRVDPEREIDRSVPKSCKTECEAACTEIQQIANPTSSIIKSGSILGARPPDVFKCHATVSMDEHGRHHF